MNARPLDMGGCRMSVGSADLSLKVSAISDCLFCQSTNMNFYFCGSYSYRSGRSDDNNWRSEEVYESDLRLQSWETFCR